MNEEPVQTEPKEGEWRFVGRWLAVHINPFLDEEGRLKVSKEELLARIGHLRT